MGSQNDIDRRALLSLGAATGAALVAGSGYRLVQAALSGGIDVPANVTAPAVRIGAPTAAPTPWSDPATWGGAVPAGGAPVTVSVPVLLDTDVTVARLTIEPGGAVVFDPHVSRTLTSTGNVVVRGALRMRPESGAVRHQLRFTGISEATFVGGGMKVLDTDVGLWCLDAGLLDLAGTPKTAWSRVSGGVPRGATSIVLQAEPVGWRLGDELAIVPSGANRHDAYDVVAVTSISGRTIGLSRTTAFAHPAVEVGPGVVLAPEVLNLTRNVSIEGTPGGRAHVIVMARRPQRMSYFCARWMGPRQRSGDDTKSVLGRYGLHFHLAGDAVRGSRVVGAVVREAGGHAFVAHESHGITFTSCISHDTFDNAYWWDPRDSIGAPPPKTHHAVYEGCVASLIKTDPAFRGYTLAGFELGAGSGNRIVDCVAVGVQGNKNASGFLWPEGSSSVWIFKRCVAHNNKVHGTFTWQNSNGAHVIEDFVCAHNGGAGIAHGAYRNGYRYVNGFLCGNERAAVLLHANSRDDVKLQFVRLHCECLGMSDHAFDVTKHTLDPLHPTQIIGCTFKGQRKNAVAMTFDGTSTFESIDLVECASTTPMLWLNDKTGSGSRVRVQSNGAAVRATIRGTEGTPQPDWNAVTNLIPPFSAEPRGQAAKPFVLIGAATAPMS